MTTKKDPTVTLRSKGDKKPARPISEEPEMQELKRMIRDGELDGGRTLEDLRRQAEDQEPENQEGKGEVPVLTLGEWTLTIRSAGGRTREVSGRIVHVHKDGVTVSVPELQRGFLWISRKDIINAKSGR